ncbi:MAG: hypothetical protein R3A50_01145 [Saprospiraceae bacterium]|nr:hypothetical protein [Saprospiraceae bacterium]MCB9345616.1 hypothetical protein [Lewinellaceae bacterium]
MKSTILPLLAFGLLIFSACEKDPPPLDLERFDVRWYDDDNSGTQSIGDALAFEINVNTTDSDPNDQYITEWDFSYFVNNNFAGVLLGDEHAHTNTLSLDLEVFIDNLTLPGPGVLGKGDVVEFRLWCIDNFGTQFEQIHRYVLED